MKKLLIATNVLLLSIILFKSYGQTKTVQNVRTSGNSSNEPQILVGGSVSLYGLLNDSTALMMSRAYRDDSSKAYIKGTKKLDARSIWFSIAQLKEFIRAIEASVSSSCESELDLGIRMYYAKYPNDSAKCIKIGVEPTWAGMHTIFMTPTYHYQNKDTSEEIDFDFQRVGDPCKPNSYQNIIITEHRDAILGILSPGNKSIFSLTTPVPLTTPIPLKKRSIGQGINPTSPNNGGRLTGPGTATPDVQNHGGLMPPPDNGGTFPTGVNQ